MFEFKNNKVVDSDTGRFFRGIVNAMLISAALGGVAAWLIHLY